MIMRLMKIQFPNDENAITFVKDLPHARWNPQDKTWCVPHTQQVQALLKQFVPGLRVIHEPDRESSTASSPIITQSPHDRFRMWMVHHGYAPNTIESYLHALDTFMTYVKKDPENVIIQDYIDFVVHYVNWVANRID